MRRTGRTTRMALLAAMAIAMGQQPKIYIVGRNQDQLNQHLIPLMGRLCEVLGIRLERDKRSTHRNLFHWHLLHIQIHFIVASKLPYFDVIPTNAIFTDHYAYDR